MAALWILFVAGFKRDEMIVGCITVAAAIAFILLVWRAQPAHSRFRPKNLIQGWRIPWYIASGVAEITVILLKDLLSIKPAESLYRVSAFDTSCSDPVKVAREVLATAYTTTAPNFIVLGIDPESRRMLFHQVQRSDVPIMTKNLGAQA